MPDHSQSPLVACYRRLQDLVLPERWLIRNFIRRHLPHGTSRETPLCIDLGGGTAPFQTAISRIWPEARYLVADIVQADRTEILADAHQLPFSDASADLLLLVHVLQHLDKPAQAIAECRRVLKPGGLLLLVYPFMTCEGRSHDLRRWTAGGMVQEMNDAGLEILRHEHEGGPFLLAATLPAELPGRMLIKHRAGWKSGRGLADASLLGLAFLIALPFRLLGFPALFLDRLLGSPASYIGGIVLARKK